MRMILPLALAVALGLPANLAVAEVADPSHGAQGLEPLAPGATVAFLGLELIDTSAEGAYDGVRADQTARLALLQASVAERLEAEGLTLVDLAPVEEELARTHNPADCNGCDVLMGEALGAAYVLTGEVQKVSNLILSMNLVLREVATGRQVRGLSVDIRGNTDDAWLRGGKYILDHQFFPD